MRAADNRIDLSEPAAMLDADAWVLRDATAADIGQVQAIYALHVLHGTGTFEEEPPSVSEMTSRWRAIGDRRLPYLVASAEGRIQGFAYASVFRPRAAYRYTVEDSIYLHPDAIGQRLGRTLLDELIRRCEDLGYRQMIAVIGDSDNARSIGLHRRLGFAQVGRLPSAGFKFGRWLDAVFMQRPLGGGDRTLPGD